MRNSFTLIVAAALMALTASGCAPTGVTVPDVIGADLNTAKSVVSSLGIVPTITEVSSEIADEGLVVKTEPKPGTDVEVGSQLKLFISTGPSKITAKDATIEWTNVGARQDRWDFFAPTIEDGNLRILISQLQLMADVEWLDPKESGESFGIASINDVFDKSVPIRVLYGNQSYESAAKQRLELVIPVSDLEVRQPTNIYVKLYAKVNGVDQEIILTFTMTW